MSTSARMDSPKSSAGSSGMASRWAERAIRAALASGRKVAIEPSSRRTSKRVRTITAL